MADGDLQSLLSEPEAAAAARNPAAWNPLTPSGIAAFAPASFQRVFTVQVLVALLATATLIWFVRAACLPTVRAAILKLPDEGRIEGGLLVTPHRGPELLAESRILSLSVDPSNESAAGSLSDFKIELHRRDGEVCSLFGCLTMRYPEDWVIQVNRKELGSRLEAWGPVGWVLLGLANLAGLLLVWAGLATLYAPAAWLLALIADRRLGVAGAWRLAAAALMPGALMMCAGQVLYGLGYADLIRVLILFVLHVLAGWILLALAVLRLPPHRAPAPTGANPFGPATANSKPDNPFAAS